MDEILEVVDVIADFGLEGVISWIIRIFGLVVFLVGIGLWIFTDMGFLLLPAVLIVGGLVLVIAGGFLFTIFELVV